MELNDFYNHGFGWICRHCERELAPPAAGANALPRFMREGEAESKQPALASAALARWADKAHTTLICPRCGITESVEK
jgi:hypothetical protein